MEILSSVSHSHSLLKCMRTVNNINVRYLDLAHKVHGESPAPDRTVLALHGLLGAKRNWASVSKGIVAATKLSVVAVDARNHGESPHHNSHTYPELASDVSKLMDKLSLSSAHVIGHSMGGRTGMALALTEPARVLSLIVVDISPVSSPGILNDFFPRLIDVMKVVDFKGATNVSQARAMARDKMMATGIVGHPASLNFLLLNIGPTADNSIGWQYNLDTLKQFFPSIATFPDMTGKTYTGPTLFIGGDQSNYLPRDDMVGIKKLFPQAELKYVAAGHNVHAENADAFLKEVIHFLPKK